MGLVLTSQTGTVQSARKRKLLLITWYFPPVNTVAAIRLGKMAHYLDQAGHDIRVITPNLPDDDRSLPLEFRSDAIIRTPYVALDQRLCPTPPAKEMRKVSDHGTATEQVTPAALLGRARQKIRRVLGQLYRDVVLYPDRRIDWLITLCPALFREIRAHRPDLILVSGPPFSSFIASAFVAWWFDIPWIAEFRDRWVDDPYAVRPRWRARFDKWVEGLLVRRSQGVVTVSDLWSRFYADKYGLPCETVMNGFDPKDFDVDLEPPSTLPLRILHAGTIYPGRRDPGALFDAVANGNFTPDEIQLQFYGRELGTVREQAERRGIARFVDLRDVVPYRQAIALQKRADILLLLQWNDPADEGNVPAKIFEYFATGRQILGLGPLGGVPARLVRDRRAGIFSNDPGEIASQLRHWLEQKRATGCVATPSPNAADGLHRDDQYRRLESFCQAIVTENDLRRQKAKHERGAPLARVLQSPLFARIAPPRTKRPILSVIIDTEADFDWHAPFSRDDHSTESILHQSRAQRIFDRFGVKPTYLIDYPVAMDPTASEMFRELVERGAADIGLQLHPWTNPPFDELLSSRNSYPSNLSRDLQRAKIERLLDAVHRNVGVSPKVFKAGRYGFNSDTAELLEDFGLDIDTSVVPFTDFSSVHGPNFRDCPHGPFWFGRNRRLLELPVTRNLCGALGTKLGSSLLPIIHSPLGLACHLPGILARSGLLDRLTLTPEGMDLADLKRLTRTLLGRGERLFTFVFHSPSLASGNTPYVQNEAELTAFLERIEGYLRYFTEELDGEGRSALEVRDLLLADGTSIPNDGPTAAETGAIGPVFDRRDARQP